MTTPKQPARPEFWTEDECDSIGNRFDCGTTKRHVLELQAYILHLESHTPADLSQPSVYKAVPTMAADGAGAVCPFGKCSGDGIIPEPVEDGHGGVDWMPSPCECGGTGKQPQAQRTCRFCGHFEEDHTNETIGCLGDGVDEQCLCAKFEPQAQVGRPTMIVSGDFGGTKEEQEALEEVAKAALRHHKQLESKPQGSKEGWLTAEYIEGWRAEFGKLWPETKLQTLCDMAHAALSLPNLQDQLLTALERVEGLKEAVAKPMRDLEKSCRSMGKNDCTCGSEEGNGCFLHEVEEATSSIRAALSQKG